MDNVLKVCASVFDPNPLPYGVGRMILAPDGTPQDTVYEYLNPAMAQLSGQQPSDLVGKLIFETWPPAQDPTWINAFYEASYHGVTSEFDSVSIPLRRFLHVVVYPAIEGYCVFCVQDATVWVDQAHTSMKAVKAGLFFFDGATNLLLLTPSALDLCGMDDGYMTLVEFARRIFGPVGAGEVEARLKNGRYELGSDNVLYEGPTADGRWLQMSIGQVGQSGRFSFGVIDDVTRRREAEERSLRHMRIVESLSKENFALYLVDLEKDTIEPYRTRGQVAEPVRVLVEKAGSYSEALGQYLNEFVDGEDKDDLMAKLSAEAMRHGLRESAEGEFAVSYKRLMNGDSHYLELRVISLGDDSSQVVLAARGTNDEVAEQLRQKLALRSALKTAEHASQAKSTFLTNMSHDFRTPMNSISGFANMALESLGNDAKVRDCLEKILLSSEHLLNLVNDILDVSRIESGKVELTEEEFDLRDLADEFKEMFEDEAAKKGMDYQVDVSGLGRAMVMADKLRLTQILVNIVGNAFKFTSAGGTVSIEIREQLAAPQSSIDYGTYLFAVRDTGIGMSPDFLDVLFDPFERAASHRGRANDGTGLGMTITKNLVDLMGGAIKVESQLGVGSTFTVMLPLRWAKGAEGDDPAPRVPRTPRVTDGQNWDFAGRRVLVVDDDMFSREIIRDALERRGALVEDAEDGADGVELVERNASGYFDAIIMDMRMPKMNGDEAARAIRQLGREDTDVIPIVAATADAFAEAYDRAREAGMNAHITKPLNVRTLVEVLGTLLGAGEEELR